MVSVFERMSKRALRAARVVGVVVASPAPPAIVATASTASALAGEYHVYSCRTPSGESAPVSGWSGSVAPGGASDDYAENTCQKGGALIAALGEQTTHIANTDRATWAFESPATEQLVGATVWRAAYVH